MAIRYAYLSEKPYSEQEIAQAKATSTHLEKDLFMSEDECEALAEGDANMESDAAPLILGDADYKTPFAVEISDNEDGDITARVGVIPA